MLTTSGALSASTPPSHVSRPPWWSSSSRWKASSSGAITAHATETSTIERFLSEDERAGGVMGGGGRCAEVRDEPRMPAPYERATPS
eukprot:3111201-Prymnesium_polylepis.1